MNSCLYKARVMHHRLAPKQHSFHYNVFMFYLDLDEIDGLAKRLKFLIRNGRIMVLTNLCTLGYQFNPVSFYFCYDEENNPICSVVEVCNTFLEMKPYFLGKNAMAGDTFRLNTTKYFYVSPFIEMDTNFDFDLQIPGDKLKIKIDDY